MSQNNKQEPVVNPTSDEKKPEPAPLRVSRSFYESMRRSGCDMRNVTLVEWSYMH